MWAYGLLGITDDAFWSLTPYEFYLHQRAWEKAIEVEQLRDKALAWHTAALSRRRRLPSLKRFLSARKTTPVKGKELEERQNELQALAAKAGVSVLNQ